MQLKALLPQTEKKYYEKDPTSAPASALDSHAEGSESKDTMSAEGYVLVEKPSLVDKPSSSSSFQERNPVPVEEYALSDKPSSPEARHFLKPSSVDATEMESICSGILPVILSMPSESEPCMEYVREVLRLTDEKFHSLHEKAVQKLTKDLLLVCNVKGAKLIQTKGSKSYTDLTCHLAVLPSEKAGSSVYSSVIVDLLESGIVTAMQKTEFVHDTVNPVWNQTLKMKLNESSKDMVVIEVWYYLNQGNMIGRAFHLLKSTPSHSENKTLQLLSQSGKEEHGTIDLHLAVKAEEKEVPPDIRVREYTLLLRSMVNLETAKSRGHTGSWDGMLSEKAEVILLKHAELSGMSPSQEKCIRFHVWMAYHKVFRVKMVVLSIIVEEIIFISADSPLKGDQYNQVLPDMKSLHSMILKQFNDHLLIYDLKAENDVNEITYMVKTLKLLFSFPPFRNLVETKDLKDSIERAIQASVPKWFMKLSEVASTQSEEELVAVMGICYNCLKHSQRARQHLNPIFKIVSIDYFSTFFVELDKLLYGALVPRIKNVLKTSDYQEHYELYLVFKDLSKLSANVNVTRRADLNITNFYQLFRSKILNWIDLAADMCKQRIEQTIRLDEKMKVELDKPRFSTSAVDAAGFLSQLGNFWKNLEWPVAADAMGLLSVLFEKISEMSMHYVEALYQSLLLDSSAMYDDKGRFQASERLCTVLNNMHHIKKTLSDLPKTLELEKYYEWLDSENDQLGTRTIILIDSLLVSRDEDIENKMYYFTDKIAEKLTPDISHFFEVIIPTIQNSKKETQTGTTESLFLWPWEKEEAAEKDKKLSNEEAISPLLDFLTSNLQVLGQYLITPILNGILFKLWNVVIGIVEIRIDKISRKPSLHYLYERLEHFMNELKNFFHADGNGTPLSDLETESYKLITKKLNILLTSSKDLILKFLLELGKQQRGVSTEEASQSQGTLQLSVGYLLDKQVLEVSVIQAKDLPGKTTLSTSVEVFLLPGFVFPKCEKLRNRTAVVKRTVNPFYGKEFLLPMKEAELAMAGASLVLFVIDMETSRVVGMSVVGSSMIPRLYAHTQSLSMEKSAPERENYTLALFTPREMTTLKEIELRLESNDLDIVHFHKANPRLFLLTGTDSTESKNFDIVNVFDNIGTKFTDLFS